MSHRAIDSRWLSPEAEEDVITQRLYGNPFAWGVTLIIIGTIFLLHTLLRVQLPVRELLPVALVALGAYMVFDYVRRRRKFRSRCEVRFTPATTVRSDGHSGYATLSHRRDDAA